MTDLDKVRDDLGFIRSSVAGSPVGAPPAVYYLWAALVVCGFALPDVRPEWIRFYWMIAAPLGALLSGYLGWRDQLSAGWVDSTLGRRQALHWATLLCVIVLGTFMVARGRIAADAFGPIVLLFLAQAYFLAGVHLDRPMRWIGVLMALGYITVLTITSYGWTLTGIVIAAAMLFAGKREARGRVVAA
jgi:hypothetical protein